MDPVTSEEFNGKQKITGKTIVDHRTRVEMRLSLEEYVLLDFIHTFNQAGPGTITFADYYRETGIIKHDVTEIFKKLKERKLMVWNEKDKRVDVSDEWKMHFNAGGSIERLWKILPKGNKPTAKARLPKVLKMISMDELASKLTAYVQHCDANNIFKKGLDVWLNPQKSHWDDPLASHNISGPGPQKVNKQDVRYK